jgi:tripartite-type tricarboxylate transporter receptor subunit TctC
MEIVNGGMYYKIGDTITFTNILGGYGVGAAANVTNVAANGYDYSSQVCSGPRDR